MPREEKSCNLPTEKESADVVKESSQSPEPICDVGESSIECPVLEAIIAIPADASNVVEPDNESVSSLCSECGKPKLKIDDSEDTSDQSLPTCECPNRLEENVTNLNKDTVEETAQMNTTEAEEEAVNTPEMSSANEPVYKELSSSGKEASGDSKSEAGSNVTAVQITQSQVESREQLSDCGSHEINKPDLECSPIVGADETVNIEEINAALSPGDSFRESRVQLLESDNIQLDLQEPVTLMSFCTDTLNIIICGTFFVFLSILSLLIGLQLFNSRNEDDSEDLDRNSTLRK